MNSLISDILAGKSVRRAILEEASADSFVIAVTGYYDTYARTDEEAKYNVIDEDFGDLENIDYSVDYSEDTMDGQRNDMVHVTYEVSGQLKIKADSEEEALELAKESDIGPLEDAEYRVTNLK